MFAGIGRNTSTNSSTENNAPEIPEWKRLLIMKKRAAVTGDEAKKVEQTRSNPRGPVSSSANVEGSVRRSVNTPGTSNTCNSNLAPGHSSKFPAVRTARSSDQEKPSVANEVEPETVVKTIGNLRVELRSVYKSSVEHGEEPCPGVDRFLTSPMSEPFCPDTDENGEDLQYGPGIVDKLRAKFLNLELKSRTKPVVRKFSSLENLSGGSMFRANGPQARGEKRFGLRALHSGNILQRGTNFKKAQSMETLLVGSSSESNNRRALNVRVFNKPALNIRTQNSPLLGTEKPPSPVPRPSESSPRISAKTDFNRQLSAPSINEDELPRPDTVKHFKRIFESPLATGDKICHAGVSHENKTICGQSPSSVLGTPASASNASKPGSSSSSAILGGNAHAKTVVHQKSDIEEEEEEEDSDAKTSAKTNDSEIPVPNGPSVPDQCESPDDELSDDYSPSFSPLSPVGSECVIAKTNREHLFISSSSLTSSSKRQTRTDDCDRSAKHSDVVTAVESEEYPHVKVAADHLPLSESRSSSSDEEDFSQGSQVRNEPERVEEVAEEVYVSQQLHLEDLAVGSDMVIAASQEDDASLKSTDEARNRLSGGIVKKPSNWQKPPPATTSIVFDFRGKDVKPNISLNPTPFGCRPAKVKKRAGSPPRGSGDPRVNGVSHVDADEDVEDEEDWDEMDIGADLPAVSGIVFAGENIKVGRGALLERRNKNLTIQFNVEATSTYEYPCESPEDESGHSPYEEHPDAGINSVMKSSSVIRSSASSGLSTYTPHVLNSSEDFQLGVSRPPAHRYPPSSLPRQCESPVTVIDEIIPASPEDSTGWSSTNTSDILF